MRGSGQGKPADVWSVGCSVVEMAAGVRPYSELSNDGSIAFQIGRKVLPRIPDTLSEEGQDFLCRCFVWEANARPTVHDLLQHPFIADTAC